MSFYNNGIRFEPFYPWSPVQQPYAPPPQPSHQPYANAGYPPAAQPPYNPFPSPVPGPGYPVTGATPYPPASGSYAPTGFYNNVGTSYPPAPGNSALPYPVHPTSAGFGLPDPAAFYTPGYPPAHHQSASYPPAPLPSAGYPTASYPPAQLPPADYPSAQHSTPLYPTTQIAFESSHYGGAAATVFRGEGTVKPFPGFNAEQDSKALRTAMKGFGTDEQAIINILGRRSNQQRQQLKLTFKTLFGRDLVSDLSSELSFRFKQTILALMMTPADYDASELNRAIKGLGTNEETLAEILCTRSNQQIANIRVSYRNLYHRELERDLIGDTSGHFRRFVVSLVTGNRREDGYVDIERARREAMELYQAGEARWGTDESKFNQILCSQSHAQLRATFDEYQRIAHRSIRQSLVRELSGDLLMGMSTIVNVVVNPYKYFADRLYKSMKGAGTHDDALIRIIVSRCEVDLVQIKQEFHRHYGQSLEAFVQDDTSGDYRKILLTLVRGC